MTSPQAESSHFRRLLVIVVVLSAVIMALVARLVDLSVIKRHFLQTQWSERAIREVVIPAYRGMITDRNGEPLAISTPVYAAWIDPTKVNFTQDQLFSLSKLLSLNSAAIKSQIDSEKSKHRHFAYLKRDLSPAIATEIKALNIPGLSLERQYQRFYPDGEASSQLVGFTNIDDIGQDGLEMEFNQWLAGTPGSKKIIQDRYGNEVSNLGVVHEPIPGHNLMLSIDNRLQYLAYHELENGIKTYGAHNGSLVILDVKTGEILAMANAPSFNPNRRPSAETSVYRNHAVTDLFEPGSTMKTIAMATALSSGKYTPNSLIDTAPGYWYVDDKKIDDDGYNNGVITLTRVLEVSSNVGISKIILSLPSHLFLDMVHAFGFAQPTGIGFPGESDGRIAANAKHSPFVLATMTFGYGISVNLLQLAHAYQTIANNGEAVPLSMFVVNTPPKTKQIISPEVAAQLRTMLESVLEKGGGTAVAARVPNYVISGKTGTTRILGPHGYEKDHHNAVFVGMAPASNPRLIIAVILRDPTKKAYFGGFVAGPVFAKVMGDALRILNVPPDNTST